MEINLTNNLAFWVLSLVIIQSALQKLECSDEIQDQIHTPLDVTYLTASDIQWGTQKRNKPHTKVDLSGNSY